MHFSLIYVNQKFWPNLLRGGHVQQVLRILATHQAKMSNLYTFCLITLLINHLSKILMTLFWPVVQRCQKCSDIWKVTSGEWAEIENVKKNAEPRIFNFCSSTRWHFLNVNALFSIYRPLVKKGLYGFLKDGELLNKTEQNIFK